MVSESPPTNSAVAWLVAGNAALAALDCHSGVANKPAFATLDASANSHTSSITNAVLRLVRVAEKSFMLGANDMRLTLRERRSAGLILVKLVRGSPRQPFARAKRCATQMKDETRAPALGRWRSSSPTTFT